MRSDLLDLIAEFKSNFENGRNFPEEGRSLYFRLDIYLEEKISSSRELKYLAEKRLNEAKEAELFRDEISKILKEMKEMK